MTPDEFAALRERLGLSSIELAIDLRKEPAQVEAWERGTTRVPSAVARDMRRLVFAADRQAMLDNCPTPECATAAGMRRDMEAEASRSPDGSVEYLFAMALLDEHAESCRTCKARRDWATRLVPPLPDPRRGWLERAVDFAGRAAGWFSRRSRR